MPSALVAIDVQSGNVWRRPLPSLGFDRAITGRYPPGSAFKVATTYSLLEKGPVKPSTPVSCPKTVVVDGMSVKNYEGESLGNPDFTTDFAHSCNTAFVQLAEELDDADLEVRRGAGYRSRLGEGAGCVRRVRRQHPQNNSKTDKAAASIGQGRNLASPLSLAVMTSGVARGSYIPPALVTEPTPEGSPSREPQPLDGTVAGQLQDLMREVVLDGTATALKGTPGGAVHGKTGTAEHGTKTPPETHAWFVGYQGDVAFAVLVEEGKSGTVAAPSPRTSSPVSRADGDSAEVVAAATCSPVGLRGQHRLAEGGSPPQAGDGGSQPHGIQHEAPTGSDPVGASVKLLVGQSSIRWANGVSLRALRTLGDLELHALSLVQRAVARGVDGGVVDEHVRAAAVLGDEAKALLSVEPLNGSLCHGVTLSFCSQ